MATEVGGEATPPAGAPSLRRRAEKVPGTDATQKMCVCGTPFRFRDNFLGFLPAGAPNSGSAITPGCAVVSGWESGVLPGIASLRRSSCSMQRRTLGVGVPIQVFVIRSVTNLVEIRMTGLVHIVRPLGPRSASSACLRS